MSHSTNNVESSRISATTELTEYQSALVHFDSHHELAQVADLAMQRGWDPIKFAKDVLETLYNPKFKVWLAGV